MKTNLDFRRDFEAAQRYIRNNFVFAGLFSCVVNVLMLTGPIFMLQIYDRVIASGSVDTLIALGALAAMLYAFMGFLDALRSRILVSVGHGFDAKLSNTAFEADLSAARNAGPTTRTVQARHDVSQLRSFLGSPALAALFDLPWIPFYLGLVFLMHTWLGLVGVIGAVVLLVVAVVSDFAVRSASRDQRSLSVECESIAEASRRNVDVIDGMGMRGDITAHWRRSHDRLLDVSARAAKFINLSTSTTKVLRLMLQSSMLATGAFLVINNAASAGVMIAASIIMTKGLQPVESAVQNWRSLLSAQRAYRNLSRTFATTQAPEQIALPAPSKRLDVEHIVVRAPEGRKPLLADVKFSMDAGQAVAIIGATGSGKSTLGRALTGVWRTAAGSVRLDGVPVEQYIPDELGRQVGYLPQDVELFDGTIAQNIARFRTDARDADIVAAAKAAGVHELITSFEGGYAARVGDRGAALSGGQRQRIGLARALFGNPFLIVLDEANANLDAAGEAALNNAVKGAKARGAVVVLIAHRPSALATVDFVAVLEGGQLADFGPRDEVLRRGSSHDGVTPMRAKPKMKVITNPPAHKADAPTDVPVPNLIAGQTA